MNRLSLLRILVLALIPLGLHWAGVQMMEQHRVMEHLLSPGPHTDMVTLVLALSFLGLRFLLFFVTPGLLLARIFLHYWEGDRT